MSKNKNESFFWTSYSDLMTSLFFVMLVLFVLTIALLHKSMMKTEADLEAKEAELAQIKKINKSIEKIDERYFKYDKEYQRHTLKDVKVKFNPTSDDINDVSDEDRGRLLEAGRAIMSFLKETQKDEALKDVQYLLIVEGQSSRDGYSENYELSYKRALALVKFWSKNNVVFDDLPCEVVISGSGYASLFREKPETVYDTVSRKYVGNPQNQRFVIHIIPKPGVADK